MKFFAWLSIPMLRRLRGPVTVAAQVSRFDAFYVNAPVVGFDIIGDTRAAPIMAFQPIGIVMNSALRFFDAFCVDLIGQPVPAFQPVGQAVVSTVRFFEAWAIERPASSIDAFQPIGTVGTNETAGFYGAED